MFGEVVISQESYREAVEIGITEGYRDALVIKEACDQGGIKVKSLNEKQVAVCNKIMQQTCELHLGEIQAIMLAREVGEDALLLMDDSTGRAFAEVWGLKVKGVLYVVMAALRRGLLVKAQAKEVVFALVRRGFRIEPKFLARVLEEIEKKSA